MADRVVRSSDHGKLLDYGLDLKELLRNKFII